MEDYVETDDDDGELPESYRGVFQDIACAKMEPPAWIVEGMLPPGLTFIAGPPKSKKSTVAMALAALVTGHNCDALPPFLSVAKRTGPALIFSAEANAGELRHMLEVGLGVKDIKEEWILVADDPFAFRLDDPAGLEQMMFWLNERDPRIVIADPLRDLHSADEKDSGDMIRVLRPIRQWAVEHESAVVMVHHTRKPAEGQQTYDALDMRGSGAIFGKADGTLMLTPRPNNAINFRATFKRAASWDKVIVLNAYGEKGGEVLDEVDILILRAINAGARTEATIQIAVRAAPPVIASRLGKLRANGFVYFSEGGFNVTERGKEKVK